MNSFISDVRDGPSLLLLPQIYKDHNHGFVDRKAAMDEKSLFSIVSKN